MSLINKVLLDLDKRQASGSHAAPPPAAVRTVNVHAQGHEWFWRTVSFLMLIALGWVGWVFYQIQPRPIATELAQQAAAKRAVVAQAAPPVVAQAPAVPVAPTPPSPPAAPPETLRFAYSIETPIAAPAPKAEPAPKPKAEVRAKPEAKKKVMADKPRFERRDVAPTPVEKAENEFRRGVDLLKRGRAAEAEGAFRAALAANAAHRGARQALVALKMERGDLEDASRLLQETLAVDPNQPDFAVALGRIYVERGNLLDALAVLDRASPAADNYGELHVLRGTVLQRLGRHGQAADAYRAALRTQAGTPHAWLGLGISLEAMQKKPEAAQAFRNALVAGPVSAELRSFAEQRIQALR